MHLSYFLNSVVKYNLLCCRSFLRFFCKKSMNHLWKVFWEHLWNSLELAFQYFVLQIFLIWACERFIKCWNFIKYYPKRPNIRFFIVWFILPNFRSQIIWSPNLFDNLLFFINSNSCSKVSNFNLVSFCQENVQWF